ncbi:ABC transporter ATP-binding protein [uncultured Cetobacterium sp.]|uniref:ABC transporter ATP-binding protein n=1 Tax=uncultured Cetobacterium sp. TaxID=527638 RepID=UPI002617A1BB|nr:ABC transporter ATP-binding protein [uncultured Cetobacterium sp.]
MNNPKKVTIKNLTKVFTSNKKEVIAVDNIDLEIQPGEFVCLLGPSGCGKTTTLRMLAGFEVPTSGNIFIGDKDIANLTPDKRNTAMVFQNYALFPHMNVYDNISYGLKIQKRSKSEIEERVKEILKIMKMEDFAYRVPSQMSGGQQQRVSLARALIMNSEVLLFDEPLSNLDAKLRLHMRDEIRKLQQRVGITSIYVTHDQAEAMALSDKIVIMKDGKIMQVGSPKDIYQKPNSEFIAKFIGRANIVKGIVISQDSNFKDIDIHGVIYKIESDKVLNVGDSVEVVVRPESITTNQPGHSGKVVKSIFMGEVHEYEVILNNQLIEICVHSPLGKIIKNVDETLDFKFDNLAMHII